MVVDVAFVVGGVDFVGCRCDAADWRNGDCRPESSKRDLFSSRHCKGSG